MFVPHHQRDNSVAHIKFGVWILYIIGIPIYTYAMLLNITTWKSDVLFIVALLLGGLKAYHDIMRNKREEKKANLENKLKEIEIREREKALRKRSNPFD